MNKRLISYASDYVSFLLDEISEKELKDIKNIILYGSVARGDADEKSDVDIFVDVIDKTEKIEKSVKRITKDFFESTKFRDHWELLGIDKNIRTITGKLDSWKDLKDSISLNGIVLYGKFKGVSDKNKPMVLFEWDSVGNNSKRVLLSKRLFGYKHYGKKYKGIVETSGGEKLGSNCILIPLEHYKRVLKIFREMKIKVRIREVLM